MSELQSGESLQGTNPGARGVHGRDVGHRSPLDAAYDALDALLAQRHTDGVTPELNAKIDAAWAHLHALQEEAAEAIGKQLDASVELPPDELSRLAQIAQALLDEED